MAEQSAIKKKILEGVGVKEEGQKTVSYSQYSMYKECPYRWSLTYKEKLFPFTSSVNSVFGTAMHETIQEWLRLLHDVSVKASEELDFNEYFFERLSATYNKEREEVDGAHFIPKEELKEYYADGIKILDYLRRKRKVLFDYRQWELIAIELPLMVKVMDDWNIYLNGFIDLLFYNKAEKLFRMPDIKTSTKGWNDYQKKDELKMDQVRLYKNYLAKHYGFDKDDVSGEYLVVKRKVYEDAEYPIPRHLVHIPAQGPGKVKLAVAGLEAFIKDCFNPDGSFQEKGHPKTPSKSACKFCPYNNQPTLCNQRAD
jgi:hypothetical protein